MYWKPVKRGEVFIPASLLLPDFEIGDTIDVHVRIIEGNKTRIQIFTGTVITSPGSGDIIKRCLQIVLIQLAERRVDLKNRLLSLNNVMSVKLELCDITRAQINLSEDKLYDPIESVPSGVVQIADLQRQGFAYIKVE